MLASIEFVEQVCQRSGLRSRSEATPVVETVVEGLGAWLDAALRKAVAAQLPRELGPALSRRNGEPPSLGELYAQLAASERIELGFAMEHVQVVVEVVGEALSSELRDRVARKLPDELGELLSGRPTELAPTPSEHARGETLAEGRVGGKRSLSEAAPGTDRGLAAAKPGSAHPLSDAKPEGAQGGSVARWDDTRDDDTLGGYRPKGED